jgi:uncharacterized protein (DUF305 family)
MALARLDQRLRWTIVAAVLVAAIVGGGLGFAAGRVSTLFAGTPSVTSAAAGFARDMQVHHNQGVELALLVHTRTDDPAIRTLAYDIATTQAQQSGQMYGWLTQWGLPQYSPDAPMAWMDDHPGHSDGGADAVMPGMASEADIAALTAATGTDADRIFLELMITHHLGAIEMADAVLDRSDDPVVTTMARTIASSQSSEIDLMESMLADLPAT